VVIRAATANVGGKASRLNCGDEAR
jgi:hypothetical protein